MQEKLKKKEPIFIEWDDKLVFVNPKNESASYIDMEDGIERHLDVGSEILMMAMTSGKEIPQQRYVDASYKSIHHSEEKNSAEGVDTSFKEEDLQG